MSTFSRAPLRIGGALAGALLVGSAAPAQVVRGTVVDSATGSRGWSGMREPA